MPQTVPPNATRIAITGLGVVTPLGNTLADLWSGLAAGRSAVRRIASFDTDDQPVHIAAEVADFDATAWVDRKLARHLDRATAFAIAAARSAIADAGLDLSIDPANCAVCVGTGCGALGALGSGFEALGTGGPKRVSPFLAAMMLPNMPAAQVSIQTGARGPVLAISTACATGADNVAAGADLIRRGVVTSAIVGGADAAITPLGIAAFAAARSLSRNDDPSSASRPFDRERDGFVMGEGAGVVVLESWASAVARGARIHAELLGYASTGDAYHITAPREDGSGLVAAIGGALSMAGLSPEQIDYVNAHGTSTQLNDLVETRALKSALGERAGRIPVSSTKSMIGHLLGAAGAVELVVSVLSIANRFVHPTTNLRSADPECDLDYVANVGRPADLTAVMSNSLGFGGHNASLIVGRV